MSARTKSFVDDSDKQRKLLAAAAVAAIPALWLGYKAYGKLFRKAAPLDEKNVAQWSAQQVAQWMSDKKFSAACVKAFVENDVDGDTLLRLESAHLSELGMNKMKDRILFDRLVQPLRAASAPANVRAASSDEEGEDDEPVAAAQTQEREVLVSNATSKDAEGQEMQKIMMTLMQQLQAIYRVCSSDAFLHGSPDTQRQTIALSREKLHEVVTVAALLPAAQKAAVAPLIQSLTQLINKVEEGLSAPQPPPRAPTGATVELDERTKASLIKLQQMLSGFMESICSDEAAALPAEEKARLTENISTQVLKIMHALEALPQPVAEPILAQCREVLRLSKELLNRPSAKHGNAHGQRLGAPAAATEEAPAVQRASLEFLVSRLRAVFEALRSPKTLQLPAEPRLQLIGKMEDDVRSVAREAAFLPDKDKEILTQVLQNVVSVLQQIKMITSEEQKMEELKAGAAAEQQPQQRSPQKQQRVEEEESTSINVEQVSGAIRSILALLKSDKFTTAPAEAQLQLSMKMLEQLEGLGEAVKEAMSPAEQQQLIPTITKVAQLVAAVAKQAAEKGTAAAKEEVKKEAEVQSAAADEDFMKIVATLKQVFEMVNSPQFQQAPHATQQNIAKELLQHVQSVEASAKSLAPAQRSAVQEMIQPLIRLLTAVAALPSQRAQQTEDNEDDEDKSGEPSEAFRAILSSLQEVFEVVNSDGFKNAPMAAQQEVSRQLLDHVKSLNGHTNKIAAPERATLMRYIEPLTQLLDAVLTQDSEEQPRSAATQSTEDDDEEEQEEESSGSAADAKATYAVLAKLQKLYAVAQSDGFLNAAAAQKQRIASMLRAELEKLERETMTLPGEQRMQVVPLIRQLAQLLAGFSAQSFVEDVEEDGNDEEADEEEEDDEELKPNAQDQADRIALFERAVDNIMEMRQRTITFEELQAMLELLDELDVAGISSQQEVAIRQALHEAIKLSIRKIQKEQGLEQDEEEEEVAEDGENEEEEEGTPATQGDMFNLTRFFQSLLQLLRSADLKNTRQLIPFTERIEATLNDADEKDLPWRRDPQAFRAVTDVLTEVQSIQQKLQSSGPSEIEQLLRTASADVLKNKPASIAQLGPYLELLEQLANMQDQMTIADLEAYQELQKAVILVRDGIVSRNGKASPSSSQQNSPMSKSKTDLTSPVFTTAAPPNTPSATVAHNPTLTEEEEPLDFDEEEEEEEGDDVEPTQEDAMIGEMLFQIYQKLQRQRHSNEELAPFERVIQQLRAKNVNRRVLQILDAVEELIEKHREVNDKEVDVALAKERQSANKVLQEETNRRSPSKAGSPAKSSSPSKAPVELKPEEVEQQALDDDEAADAAEESVVDGLNNQLALLPRILERLQLSDFMQNTTLFEIQCIGRVLVHLGEARTVNRNANLRAAVERAKQLFGEHMQNFQGTVKDGASVTCAMQLTGMTMELEKGEKLTQYTLIGAEEEEYTINEGFVSRLDGNALEVGQPSKDVEKQWDSSSRSIIFSIQQYPEGNENATSLSELTMLVDALDVHSFDTTSVPAEGISAQDAEDVICSVLSERPSRLLVYYNTPYPDSIAPEMHAVTFADGTTLAHRRVLELCKGLVERVVIVHDQTRRLEVVASRDGVKSSYVSIALTEGAAQVANTSRCWLFDGVFTPAVVETISSHNSGYLCPEELITGPLGQLAGKTISQGSFSDEPALKMAFFAASN